MYRCDECQTTWSSGPGNTAQCTGCGVEAVYIKDPPPFQVPKDIREATVLAWGKGTKMGRHHAAKQLAGWMLDNTAMKDQDENAVVDNLLLIGMAAEVQYSPELLIKYFEDEILVHWCGKGRKKR